MDHQITRDATHEEAIGAHSGFRIRVVTTWDAPSRSFQTKAYVRGSETEQEQVIDTAPRSFALLQDAQDHGFAMATTWIDAQSA